MSIHVYNFESHSQYTCEKCQAGGVPQNWLMPSWEAGVEILAVIPAAFAFGMCGYAFEWLLHHFKDIFGKLAGKASFGNAKGKALLTPFIGGWFVVLLWFGLNVFDSLPSFNFKQEYDGTDAESSTFAQAYLGLSVYEPGMSISSCFLPQGNHTWQKGPNVGHEVQRIQWYAFLLKLIFTTLTLGAGFKGGEVTPIFFIGAALGNVCGQAMKQDTQLFSGLGLVAVFGACANTPIAVTFMGIELFGGAKAFPFLVANFIAYIVSNTEHVNGIYGAQDKPRGGVVTVTPFSRRVPHHV